MKIFSLLVLISAVEISVSASNVVRTATTDTPISKVIELLEDMTAKGIKEKEAEATRFSAFSQWCGDQTRIKTNEITDASDKIEMFSANIQKATVTIQSLTDRIHELEEDIGRWRRDTKSASDVRSMESADYKATSLDYSESLDALDEAIMTLKREAHKTPQADSTQVLLQVTRLKSLPVSAQRALLAFLQQPNVEEMPDKQLFFEAPEAHGYEFQSGGVVEMLDRLKAEFEKKKYELDVEERKAQHSFEDIVQLLTDNTENAKHEIDKKTTLRAEVQESKAEMEGEKAQTETDRAEDQKYLNDMTGLCAQKKDDFTSRQVLRTGELEALHKAVEILRSETVAGAGEKHLPALAQIRATSFAQLRNGASEESPLLQSRVAAFLADRAKTCNSRVLLLASQGASANPFVKVKKMIKDLISKLMQESTAETEHKGWCDTELTTNKQTRDQKTEAVEQLTAEKEDLHATIVELTQDIADLTTALAELQKAMTESTQDRAKSKEVNQATINDAKVAQIAVQQAIVILKDFYAKSSQAVALTQSSQVPAEDAPETFDKPYQGLLPEGGNVLDFLEVIQSDFVRLGLDTTTAEAAEQDEYKKYMFESEKDQALKQNEKGHKESKKEDKESTLAATEQELKLSQAQLDKAIEYYEKLKPSCVGSGITYEERVKRREEEIQSLQEALKILTGTDLA